MTPSKPSPQGVVGARGVLTVVPSVVIGLALIGLLAGTRESGYTPNVSPAGRPHAGEPSGHTADGRGPAARPARPARSYTELMVHPWGDEPTQADALRRTLEAATPTLVPSSVASAKADALVARAAHRAFSGAPPTIPHPIAQATAQACQACHERGGTFGATRVPPMAHVALEQCTQCHVPERSDVPPASQPFAVASTFEPLRGAPAPSRWSAGAPPQMPHTSHMRQRCTACHGRFGQPGLQSSHAERRSCPQCHAPAAILEAMPEMQ